MRRPGGHPCLAAVLDTVMSPMARLRPGVVSGARGRVLEVGSGTGLNFPLYPPGAEVDAVEPDPWMRRRSQRRVATAGIRLHEAGAERLPFPDQTFDTLIVTFAFCTIPDVSGAMAELLRVARPDAELRFAEHVRSPQPLVAKGQQWVDPAWTYLSGGCHLDRDPVMLLQEAGFVSINVRPRSGRWALLPIITGTAQVPRDPPLR